MKNEEKKEKKQVMNDERKEREKEKNRRWEGERGENHLQNQIGDKQKSKYVNRKSVNVHNN